MSVHHVCARTARTLNAHLLRTAARCGSVLRMRTTVTATVTLLAGLAIGVAIPAANGSDTTQLHTCRQAITAVQDVLTSTDKALKQAGAAVVAADQDQQTRLRELTVRLAVTKAQLTEDGTRYVALRDECRR